jgi:hypothetical protein
MLRKCSRSLQFPSSRRDQNKNYTGGISVKAAILSCTQYYFLPWRAIGAVYSQLACEIHDTGIQIAGAP